MPLKYDVAFSFLAQDEPLATELNDLLEGRVSTFLYSKRQEALAGTDGEISFASVFGEEARLVVVLYRAGWGDSPWTRIEQTAIRNRAFEHGYDFVTFIPLDDPPQVPKWLPRTQLWIGLKRWGQNTAAGLIEARVQQLGGEAREESISDKAARVERSLKFSEKRKNFLRSQAGVDKSNQSFAELVESVEREVAKLSAVAATFRFALKKTARRFVVVGRGPALDVGWRYHYANSLDDAELTVTLWRGHPPWPGIMHYEEPQRLRDQRFKFDLVPPEHACWISTGKNPRMFSSRELAEYLIGYCIEQTEKHND